MTLRLASTAFIVLGLCLCVSQGSARADDAIQNLHAQSTGTEDSPNPGLILGSDGSFYGTAQGYNNNNGSVFSLTGDGTTYATVYPFSGGQRVISGVTEGPDGNLYGTIYSGQAPVAKGAVFKLTKTGVYTTLHAFTGDDGASPAGPVLVASDGTIYGTTNAGGASTGNSWGTIFQIDPAGTFSTLYDFSTHDATIYGKNARSRLIFGTDGTIYGTTTSGGADNRGTIFALAVDNSLSAVSLDSTIGSGPYDLLQGCNGYIYGRAFGGNGVIFEMDPSTGVLGVLHGLTTTDGKFDYNSGDGDAVGGMLIQGTNGSLFGTAQYGGSHNGGTIFELTADGAFTIHVNATIGPLGIAQGLDGNLYGTAAQGQLFVDMLAAAEKVPGACSTSPPIGGTGGPGGATGTVGAGGAPGTGTVGAGGTTGTVGAGGATGTVGAGGTTGTTVPPGAGGTNVPTGPTGPTGAAGTSGGAGVTAMSSKSGGCSLGGTAPSGTLGLVVAGMFAAAIGIRRRARRRS